MPQADRAFVSIARHRGIRAAALLWIWLTVVFAPLGATLHAMSHLELPSARAAIPDEHKARHGAVEHCHVCDEWQFLDHVLPSATLLDAAGAPAVSPAPPPLVLRLTADTPWILPRAPPARQSGFIAQR